MKCKNNKFYLNTLMFLNKKYKQLFLLLICALLMPATEVLAQSNALQRGDILVSEILFNPLPSGADYVELYNNTDYAIALAQLRLAKVSEETITRLYPIADSGTILPHDFIVITTDASYVTSNYTVRHPQKLIEVSSMPSYNNASGTVMVTSTDTLILDRFDYTEDMHSRLLRDKEGVALERRSYASPTQDAANWYSAATNAGYGTPTYRNSQSHEFLFLDNEFAFSQRVFSPDGDGYNDLLDLTYDLQLCDLSANISVYDNHGRLVRRIGRGVLLGCSGILTWDGIDDDGRQCPRGSYIIIIEAYNTNGASQSWRRSISLVRQ